ncbi:MAG: transporter [Steroidobacteraceae bacterium]|nr:transporter [Steroidobacteraceae bacterium]
MPIKTLTRKLLQARPGEERAVGLAFLYFFLLLCSYYLLRPLRDAMAPVAGFENLAWLFTATFVAMLALAPFFGMLVARVRKQFLLPISYGFFALNLLAFYLLFKFDPDSRWVAIAFFVWLSVFNMFVVSIFWSFMVDVFRDEEAKRLFGPIAAGGGTGAIIGPLLTQTLAERIGVDGVVGLSMLLLLATLPCIQGLARWAQERHGHFVLPPTDPEARIGGSALAGMKLVAKSPYLIGVFAIIAIGSIAGTFMYFELQQIAAAAYPEIGARTTFYARLDFAVNLLAWVFQGFVVSHLIRRFELAGALLAMPLVALLSFAWLAAMPVLMLLSVSQVIRRGGEFGIAKPCREVLFTIVDPETKYKAKNFIDTVLYRGSDMVGGWLHLLLSGLGFALTGFAVICGVGMLGMTIVAGWLGREFARREAELGTK